MGGGVKLPNSWGEEQGGTLKTIEGLQRGDGLQIKKGVRATRTEWTIARIESRKIQIEIEQGFGGGSGAKPPGGEGNLDT